MGQYWTIVNLDKRQKRSSGKLGEDLFNGIWTYLPTLLTRPTGIGSANLDEILESSRFVRERKTDKINRTLKSCHETSGPISKCGGKVNDVSHPPFVSRSLLTLPVEILTMVFDLISADVDVIYLSMASKTLWYIGYNCLQKRYCEDLGEWAGDRLICLGDYFSKEDLPEGVSVEDVKGLEPFGSEEEEEEEDEGSTCTYVEWSSPCFPPSNYYDWKFSSSLSALSRSLYFPLVSVNVVYDMDREWILCNLTKHEYIRGRAIADMTGTENSNGPFMGDRLNLGTVLITRICWSSELNTSLSHNPENIHRGAWAGHRIKITTVDKINDDLSTWKDISDVVVKDIEAIWEADCGGEWKDMKCW
ncbi:hypothetical protein QCA50_008216 [Cerrena zonata]|uniref:F-box domain-containing protein n=1 Tax=Cerrena zonata TaxID=2478898 RepID=A0AAW0G5V5_9APHY